MIFLKRRMIVVLIRQGKRAADKSVLGLLAFSIDDPADFPILCKILLSPSFASPSREQLSFVFGSSASISTQLAAISIVENNSDEEPRSTERRKRHPRHPLNAKSSFDNTLKTPVGRPHSVTLLLFSVGNNTHYIGLPIFLTISYY